jgi:hypothetical protein
MDIMSWIREQEANDAFLLGEEFGTMTNFVKIGKRIVNLDKVQTVYYEQNGGLNYDSPCVVIDFGGPENYLCVFDKYEPEAYAQLLAWMAERPTLFGEEIRS